jgi:hypothetical protein
MRASDDSDLDGALCGDHSFVARRRTSAPGNPVSNGRDKVCKRRPEPCSRADSHYRFSSRRRPAPDRADTRRLAPSSRADTRCRFPNRRQPALGMGDTRRLAPCSRAGNHIHIVRLRPPRCPGARQRSHTPPMRFLLVHACDAPQLLTLRRLTYNRGYSPTPEVAARFSIVVRPILNAEVAVHEIGVAPQFGRGALVNHVSVIEDVAATRHQQRRLYVLFDDEDRASFLGKPPADRE